MIKKVTYNVGDLNTLSLNSADGICRDDNLDNKVLEGKVWDGRELPGSKHKDYSRFYRRFYNPFRLPILTIPDIPNDYNKPCLLTPK
ncbi:MAG TPA: hypothetical protein PKA28_07630 [Methylomusa anaerophila]|uniref:hypothetical protein n=1 Tax=Methylomusa anaerophila TaxID=1930071 RepID=UPI0011AE5478|nr:hypothetical protein [Methylomusa anaerophila]HML88302.1 hypothetical protein [Methylomusa anaerophila]